MSEVKRSGNVVCTKCGTQASSKCPHCRSVFVTDDSNDARYASLLQSFMLVDRGNYRDKSFKDAEGPDLILAKDWRCDVDGKPTTLEENLICLRDTLGKMSDNCIRMFCCKHDWQFAEGCHSSIGCGH